MEFTNFWCNVSKMSLGNNVHRKTIETITEAFKKYCDPKQSTKISQKTQNMINKFLRSGFVPSNTRPTADKG